MRRGDRVQHAPLPKEVEEVGREVVDAAYSVHVALGPGLLESVYETCLCHELKERNLRFERQVAMSIEYRGVRVDKGLRLDLLVEDFVVCELKAVEALPQIAMAQMLTYLKLADKRLGFLINFSPPHQGRNQACNPVMANLAYLLGSVFNPESLAQ